MEAKERMMTVQEAVDWLFKSLTKEYRRTCLAHWKATYPAGFAEEVASKFLERWKKK